MQCAPGSPRAGAVLFPFALAPPLPGCPVQGPVEVGKAQPLSPPDSAQQGVVEWSERCVCVTPEPSCCDMTPCPRQVTTVCLLISCGILRGVCSSAQHSRASLILVVFVSKHPSCLEAEMWGQGWPRFSSNAGIRGQPAVLITSVLGAHRP